MKVVDYNDHVHDTDQYKLRSREDRRNIAIYGLVGEIGSLLSAVKKKLLAEDGEARWDQPNDEIAEEIGDVIWYCFSLAQTANSAPVNILTLDIALLKREIGSNDDRATKIKAALDPDTRARFLAAAEHFPRTRNMCFDDYQRLAFLTARTSGKQLLEVCLAVLWQLGAELLRTTMPKIETALNRNVADRPVNTVLGEIAWHLSAVASLYRLSLDTVVERNVTKLNFRKQGIPTPLHDCDSKASEQFPRRFEVQFVSIGAGKLRMYLNGKRLGNDLTDNAHSDDGYRFHDILHLSLIAHLGWSPVLRGLMKRKRREPRTDEVEDGARAQIVEELVIKAIHTEGERLANESGRCDIDGPVPLFPSKSIISFRFLKMIHSFVEGLEVEKNAYWEWENAIFEGTDIFFRLRKEQRGSVVVDLENRRLTFSPDVYMSLRGSAVGLGLGSATLKDLQILSELLSDSECIKHPDEETRLRAIATKRAVLSALNFPEGDTSCCESLKIALGANGQVCLKATGEVEARLRAALILDFRCAFATVNGATTCTAMAIADPADLAS